jgi:hypothetical protein
MICKACGQQYMNRRNQTWTLPGSILDGKSFDVIYGVSTPGFLTDHVYYCEPCLRRFIQISVLTRLMECADAAVINKISRVFSRSFLEVRALGKSDAEKEKITLVKLIDFIDGQETL